MTVLDDKALPKVLAAIARVGGPATYKSRSTTQSASGSPTIVDTEYAVTISPPMKQELTLEGGEIGQSRDGIRRASKTVFYLAGSGLPFVPAQEDRIVESGKTWTVTEVRPMRSGASVAAWALEVH